MPKMMFFGAISVASQIFIQLDLVMKFQKFAAALIPKHTRFVHMHPVFNFEIRNDFEIRIDEFNFKKKTNVKTF